jgi:hypothetical protein
MTPLRANGALRPSRQQHRQQAELNENIFVFHGWFVVW